MYIILLHLNYGYPITYNFYSVHGLPEGYYVADLPT